MCRIQPLTPCSPACLKLVFSLVPTRSRLRRLCRHTGSHLGRQDIGMASHSAAGHCKVMAHCSPEPSLTQGRRRISLAHQPCHAQQLQTTRVGQQTTIGQTWKDLSRLCHTQLRWMISITAEPGCKNCALARLEVCTLMNRPVSAMALSCVSKGVAAVNSTTRTCTAQTHQSTLSSKLLSISTDQMLAGSPWLCVLGQPRAM